MPVIGGGYANGIQNPGHHRRDWRRYHKALQSTGKCKQVNQGDAVRTEGCQQTPETGPLNTELVVQKQKMLKDAIEATKEKLATLKTAAQQANEQLANGEITQQQYDALQREIVETEQNLRSLQDQAATTNATFAKIDEAGEKLQNIGSSVENVGKKFLPVTAAVTGLGTAAVKTAADFDSEMSKVSAISGATGDDFDQLRAKAREMGAKTKFSASEAASAMEYMAMAGWKTGDMLNGIEGIMNLAAASGEDLATTSGYRHRCPYRIRLIRCGFWAFCRYPCSRFFQCEHQCLHDGRDVQVLCAYRRCAWVLGRGYRRSHRSDGKQWYQGFSGWYFPSYHHEQPFR